MNRTLYPFAAGLLLALIPGPDRAKAAESEIWFSPRAGRVPGDGSRQRPFEAGGPAFDERLRALPPGSTVRLLPGTYETRGFQNGGPDGILVKSGWTLTGAGVDRTTLRLIATLDDRTNNSGRNYVLFSGWGPTVSNVTISDLTIDCNYRGVSRASGLTNLSLHGIGLYGRDLVVRQVKVVNAAGYRSLPGVNPESFPIHLGIRGLEEPGGNLRIENCEVSSFAGGAATGIATLGEGGRDGIQGVIRGNRVVMNHGPAQFGYSGYGSNGLIVEQNWCSGAVRGFNWDTGGHGRNLIIRSNQFLNCRSYGVLIGGSRDGLLEGNTIEMDGTHGAAVVLSAPNQLFAGASGWVVRGNTLRRRTSRPGELLSVHFWNEVPPPGITFENNRIDPSLGLRVPTRGFARWNANVDLRNREYRPAPVR